MNTKEELGTCAAVTLHLLLCVESADLGAGTDLKVPGGARAKIDMSADEVHLRIALPTLSATELRYVVDQAVKSVRSLVEVGETSFEGRGVGDDIMLTIGLDLHHRTKGRLRIVSNSAVEAGVLRMGRAEDLYRAWVNEDPSTRTSIQIAQDVTSWAEKHQEVSVRVMEESELQKEGLRLLLAVGGASEVSPPRLVLAEYRPAGGSESDELVAIVGKGVTFDTGGINVKPYASFVSMMKNDMGGAALACALFQSLVESDYKKPLLLVVPTCENAVGEKAMRPGALVTSYSGKTVRIDHTDAEGRLILADALAFAGDTYHPKEFICFATLTTAALNAYGPFATPVHFCDEERQQQLEAAGASLGEDFHFFPQRIWHSIANEDKEADLRNTARLPGNASAGAGSRNAAHFLLEFANAPLCHFDIFASTWNWSGEAPGAGYGATGAPLRSLLRAFQAS